MNHKAYFFILDGMIALIVLVSGILIFGAVFVGEPVYQPPYNYGEDLLRTMSSANLSNFDLTDKPGIKSLITTGKIPGTQNQSTPLLIAGRFFYEYCEKSMDESLEYANTTIFEIIDKVIPRPFDAEVLIEGESCPSTRIYTSYRTLSKLDESQLDAKVKMVTQKVVFGNYDLDETYGPYVIRMVVWR